MPESKRRKPKSASRPSGPANVQAASKEPSPAWYVVLMAGLMVLGLILVLIRFIFQLDQLVLVVGLVLIAAGFMMTTNYR